MLKVFKILIFFYGYDIGTRESQKLSDLNSLEKNI